MAIVNCSRCGKPQIALMLQEQQAFYHHNDMCLGTNGHKCLLDRIQQLEGMVDQQEVKYAKLELQLQSERRGWEAKKPEVEKRASDRLDEMPADWPQGKEELLPENDGYYLEPAGLEEVLSGQCANPRCWICEVMRTRITKEAK